ncbi:unnamed protein product [Urochloa decumbens]|uniref:F-box domain-containing protein n=1 Tax=Urochloa decumbens TaxID=240449 RepID=A0ABC9GB94_9POAL
MGQSAAAKRPKPSAAAFAAAGEDRLSALPDDVLVVILLRLDTAAAVRTSAVSRRWRRVWALLPELRFPNGADPRLVASALASHEAAISYLGVEAVDAALESVEACLAVAAGRLSGRVIFQNRVSGGNAGGDGKEETGDLGSFELPCFESATTVSLDLGFLGLAMPLAGVFARLTDLSLSQQLLKRFQALLSLQISLFYPKDIGSFQYAMEELTKLPCLTSLAIMIRRNGHTFGASLFHVLRMCSDIRNLVVLLLDLEEPFMCPSGCVCGHSMDWNTEGLTLNFLQEVAIDMEGTDHQVAVVKRLFTWAVVLKRMQITFHPSLSECKVRELRQMLSSFSGPETRVEFYMYHTSGTMKFDRKRYLLGP